MAVNVTNLGVEGLRSINRYFFYQLVAVILAIIAEVIAFTLIGSASAIAGAALQSAQSAGLIAAVVLLVIIELVLLVFSVYLFCIPTTLIVKTSVWPARGGLKSTVTFVAFTATTTPSTVCLPVPSLTFVPTCTV